MRYNIFEDVITETLDDAHVTSDEEREQRTKIEAGKNNSYGRGSKGFLSGGNRHALLSGGANDNTAHGGHSSDGLPRNICTETVLSLDDARSTGDQNRIEANVQETDNLCIQDSDLTLDSILLGFVRQSRRLRQRNAHKTS